MINVSSDAVGVALITGVVQVLLAIISALDRNFKHKETSAEFQSVKNKIDEQKS